MCDEYISPPHLGATRTNADGIYDDRFSSEQIHLMPVTIISPTTTTITTAAVEAGTTTTTTTTAAVTATTTAATTTTTTTTTSFRSSRSYWVTLKCFLRCTAFLLRMLVLQRSTANALGLTRYMQLYTDSSVQFSSRWYLCARKSPYALHPVSQKFPQRCF